MSADDRLIIAAQAVDVIDTAGRVIAHPHRHAPSVSAGEVLALACAVEKLWAVALEADLLVRALKLPITGNDNGDAARDAAIDLQSNEVSRLMAAIRGETPQEPTDANRDS